MLCYVNANMRPKSVNIGGFISRKPPICVRVKLLLLTNTSVSAVFLGIVSCLTNSGIIFWSCPVLSVVILKTRLYWTVLDCTVFSGKHVIIWQKVIILMVM